MVVTECKGALLLNWLIFYLCRRICQQSEQSLLHAAWARQTGAESNSPQRQKAHRAGRQPVALQILEGEASSAIVLFLYASAYSLTSCMHIEGCYDDLESKLELHLWSFAAQMVPFTNSFRCRRVVPAAGDMVPALELMMQKKWGDETGVSLTTEPQRIPTRLPCASWTSAGSVVSVCSSNPPLNAQDLQSWLSIFQQFDRSAMLACMHAQDSTLN